MNYYFFNDAIQSEAVYLARRISIPKEAILLSDSQVEMFVSGLIQEGKRRKAGTLDLEDIPPKPTDELFTEEMAALNAEYDKNMSVLANRYNIAIARDGSSETAKVTSIRTEISELDNQYDLDQIAVFEKHYGA